VGEYKRRRRVEMSVFELDIEREVKEKGSTTKANVQVRLGR